MFGWEKNTCKNNALCDFTKGWIPDHTFWVLKQVEKVMDKLHFQGSTPEVVKWMMDTTSQSLDIQFNAMFFFMFSTFYTADR